ncbi:uncharacterized protein LOC142236407 isoform X2 [Haematobia irritans]|uniref:uncharacterized protein LOC142236407 isoform X2 n=1 Tax=Haematobia irritans TaxID=7368 RepID=UPI003F50B80C
MEGKAVNIMFGSDIPKLMNLILAELNELGNKKRNFYEISQYQPEEEAIRRAKEDAIAQAQRIEFEAKEKKRLEYLNHVTDVIMENLCDIGVTLFGPQVTRDLIKMILESADGLKIQCKDRKFIQVSKEMFDTINFACPNPIDGDILEQLDGKELLVCFWKITDDSKDIPKVLNAFAKELTVAHTYPPDEFNEDEIVVPPILKPLDVKVELEIQDGDTWEEPYKSSSEEDLKAKEDMADIQELENYIEEEIEEQEVNIDVHYIPSPEMPNFDLVDAGLDDIVEENKEQDNIIDEPKKKMRIKKIRIPPIWVPNNHRTHAAMIYVFFRSQTTSFLPPDPVPDPPHIIMAFDTLKKRDLINHAEQHKDDIPMYGFFTSDDANEAEFISNSLAKYKARTANDKIVLKVNKATSYTMLSLVTYDPSYISPNVMVGQQDAKKFFPESYKTAEQEMLEEAKTAAEDPTKKKKGKQPLPDENEMDDNK